MLTSAAHHRARQTAVAALAEANEELDELRATLVAELASGHMALLVPMEVTLVAGSTSGSATTPSTSPGDSPCRVGGP